MLPATFDPDNRLVADALEADWNEKLRALAAAQEAYEKERAADTSVVTDAERAELMALATDFPRLWRDPRTQMKEKKRMLRLLIEDVTLTKGDTLHVDIRFVSGATHLLDLPLLKSCLELRTTDADVVKEIDQLIDTYTDGEIADVLNERGVRTVVTTPWTAARIGRLPPEENSAIYEIPPEDHSATPYRAATSCGVRSPTSLLAFGFLQLGGPA